MKSVVLLIGFMSAANDAHARDCTHTRERYVCVEYVDNFDGDTITVNIPGIDPNFGEKIGIRVYGIDAAERISKDPCERQMALIAKDEVENIMKNAVTIELRNPQRGKYFRILAEVWVNGRSLANYMLKMKLAVPYFGETKPVVNWCKYL